jgi:hypothetical protein
MNSAAFAAILSLPSGAAIAWAAVEGERESFARESESFARERESFARESESFARERKEWPLAREAWARERALCKEQQMAAVAALQHRLDVALGRATARAVLERIGLAEDPGLSVTDAINRVCMGEPFQAYLTTVSIATTYSAKELTKSAKSAYSVLSGTIHGGSMHTFASNAISGAVMPDKITLVAVAALFKFFKRDVHFYCDIPGAMLKLPSPPRSSSSSAATSAAPSPPKASAAGGGVGGGAESAGAKAAESPAVAAAAAAAVDVAAAAQAAGALTDLTAAPA